MKRLFALLALIPCLALAAGWGLTRSYGTYSTEAACKAAAASQPAGSYLCTNVLQSPVTVGATAGTWQFLVNESAAFTVSGTKTVRYGAGTAFKQRDVTTSGTCDNVFFQGDPAVGVAKHCDVWTGTTAPPAATVGSATVSWVAPTKNADGTSLTDLAGFRVVYGQTAGTYSQSVDASASPAVIQALSVGRWFFAVKAVDTSGNESAPSTEVSKTIQ